MKNSSISNQKYMPGPLPEICAPRAGLLAKLNEAAARHVVYISAPAGAGKTVGAVLWARASGRKTIWIGLDALHNATSVFYRKLCAGILAVQPGNARMAAILESPAFEAAPVEHTINLLAAIAEKGGGEYALVLDDFHTITNTELQKSLPLILRRLPPSFLTLILSRAEPASMFADWIVERKAAAISAMDLAFSEDEIGAYFSMLGRSAANAKEAHALTGGLAIFVNALAQGPATYAFVTALTQRSAAYTRKYSVQLLERYLRKYLWDAWGEDRRVFMLRSAVLDEMPVELCESITGQADAGRMLEELRAGNTFVARVGEGVYRYHQLFLDFLRAQPEYAQVEKTKSYQMAAAYYLAEQAYASARQYASFSGDAERMAEVLHAFCKNRGQSIGAYLDFTKGFFMAQNMEAICEQCPALYLDYAWTAFLCGDTRIFEFCADRLQQLAPTILQKHPQFGGMLLALILLDYRAPLARQIRQAALLPVASAGDEQQATAMAITMQMPFLHRSSREYYKLTDMQLYGKLEKACGKLLQTSDGMMIHGVAAGLLLEQNRVNDALAEARACVAMLHGDTAREMHFAAWMHLAAVYLAQGKEGELANCLVKLRRFIGKEAQFLRPNFLAFAARIKLWGGDADAAQGWLSQYFVTGSDTLEPYRLYQYFTTARAFAVLGELTKARDLAKRLRHMGYALHRPQDAAEAGALLAAVHWAMGDKKEAQEVLENVLLELQPHGFVRLIADEGAAVLPILKKITVKTARGDDATGLDFVYVNKAYLAAYSTSRQRVGILAGIEASPAKLSGQQKLVLGLLAKGYNREGIVQQTGLTVNTVKTHTRLAYEKLGVGSAAEAVVRARELGILE